jgi:hypothetical protein
MKKSGVEMLWPAATVAAATTSSSARCRRSDGQRGVSGSGRDRELFRAWWSVVWLKQKVEPISDGDDDSARRERAKRRGKSDDDETKWKERIRKIAAGR